MRRILIASPFFLLAASVFGAFTPYYTDPLTSINTTNWGQNGTLTASSSGLTSSNANGGSLISKITPPVSSYEYEADITLALTASGGTFDVYLDASTDALSGPTPSGTYYVFELTPTFSGSTCTATLIAYKRVSGTITLLGTTTVPCHNGTVLRTVRTSHGQICAFIDNVPYAVIAENSITSGMPGVGVRNAPAGNSITQVSLYPIVTTPPNPVNPQTVGTSVFPTRVDLQWQPPSDPNGPGVNFYYIHRNSTPFATVTEPEFSDETATAGTNYTYSIIATDYHQNQATTNINITTPPTNAIDPRRVGVRPMGSYWGAAGEQIDTLSGNLNYSTQLFQAMGRGGSAVGLNLSYNSQLWRQDLGGTWKLDDDVGYGLGWRLQAGSIIPFYSGYLTIDHYTFIDPTGAEYRLDQNNSGIWSSIQGIHVWYDSTVTPGILHFPDGSLWAMGSISAGTEQDAGTEYPTVMTDSNGNQIFLRYNDGLGVTWTNSSARFTEIEDVRAIYNSGTGTRQSYTFTYNTDPIPHLTQINNVLGKGSECYTLGYLENQALSSPFTPSTSFGTTTLLNSLAVTSLGYSTSFTYDSVTNSGELTSITSPLGGKIRWAYRPFTFNGSRTLREVQNRYLTMTSGGTESAAYAFTRNAGDSSLSLHSGLTLDDPSGVGESAWTFSTTGAAWQLGLATQLEERPSAAQASNPLKRQAFTWVQDSAGNPYIGTALMTLDPTGANVQSQVTQTLDTYGNVTQTNTFDYGNLTTAARTYNYTYVTNTNYASLYIRNRLQSAVVSNSAQNVTLVTNTYDSQPLQNISSLYEHGANYGTSFVYRGNVTVIAPVGGPSETISFDITGTPILATDSLGHTVSITTDSTTNYTAPTAITPNSNTSLQTTATYTQWLVPGSITQPNSATSSTTYNSFGRPQQSTSVYGAQTNYTYSQNGALPMVITATTNGHWTKTTLDGFGRTIEFDRGYNNGSTAVTVSTVNTVYASFSGFPLGTAQKASQPYAPGGTQYWITYCYDGRGRIVSVVLPDGASTSTYAYSGNTTTITDPAGKWKQQVSNVFGNLKTINEPNPAGGANFSTSYTHDVMNHLTQVSMPRGSTTQTRTFAFDPSTQRLSSQTHPESGTTSYTYNADGTLATRTDAKGQIAQYTYDSYQRVTEVQRFPTPGHEDLCQQWVMKYDTTQPFTGITATNAAGRLTEFSWGGSCTMGAFEAWAYTPAGLVSQKPSLTYNYDSEGKVTVFTPPGVGSIDPAKWYTYSFDLMDRPVSMTDNSTNVWVQNVQYGPADEITQMTRLWLNPQLAYTNQTETRQYNALGQLTRITIPTFLDQEYVYSTTQNNGGITQTIDHINNETVSYTYDALNRLATANSSLGWGLSFTYDGFGNLTDKTVTAGSPPALHVTVDPTTNRLTGGGYTYDANGNLTGITGQFTATYNVDNQIQTFSPASGGTASYYYDMANRRGFLNDPNNGVSTTAYGAYGEHFNTIGASGWDNRNIYFGTQLIWNFWVSASGYVASTHPIALDRLGSLRTYGIASTNYYPFGEEYATTAQDREKFATYIRDGISGLDYAMNRHYSSTLGRFLSPDPTNGGASLADPRSLNRYTYGRGDPINRYDPSGLDDYAPGDDCGDDCTDPPQSGGGGGGEPVDPTPPIPLDPCAGNSMLSTGCAGAPPDPTDPCAGSSLVSNGCPAPIVIQPPDTLSIPICTLTLYSRSLDWFGVRHLPINLHGYLDLTNGDDSTFFEGLHAPGNLLKAGSGTGNNPSVNQNDGSISGPAVCSAFYTLSHDEAEINGAPNITYNGRMGPNSNSVLRYMLQSLNIIGSPSAWYTVPFAMQVFGYWKAIPGLEVQPSSSSSPPIRGRHPGRRPL